MRFTQALLIATAYAGVTYDDEDGSFEALMSIDGDNLKVDATITLKKEEDDWTVISEGFMMFMYMLTNDDAFNGLTVEDIMKKEAESGEKTELADGKWAAMLMAGYQGGEGEVQGGGALGDEEWDGTDAGWTGTQTLAAKEWTITASRPLNAKPALTEGDTAYHTAVFFLPDLDSETGVALYGPAFTETVVGGAATLAAGATLAATMLF